MIVKHNSCIPEIDQSAYIAPNALVCGNVTIGKNCKVMFGAQIIAEGNKIDIEDNTVILENAVLRSVENHSLFIGRDCLIGPNTHIVGCRIEEQVFVATGASIFHGAQIMSGSEIRINAIVHIKSVVEKNTTVPIGWIAVGNPSRIFSPDKHDEIWKIQEPLNFPKTVYNLEREEASIQKIVETVDKRLETHKADKIITKGYE
jgi:carbonic anhydrase/acetyltransferase-like protein (isoleucine patch superfamily)